MIIVVETERIAIFHQTRKPSKRNKAISMTILVIINPRWGIIK